MSLQVWLPLNGDLRNQGVTNTVPELVGTGITYVNGKTGRVASFPNNCASYISFPGLKLQTGSIAAWIKILGEGSGAYQYILSEGRDTGSIGTNIWAAKAGTTLYARSHKVNITYTNFNLNTWYHVAMTFGNNALKLYINGELFSSVSYTENTDYAQSTDRFVLGKMSYNYNQTSNYFPFNGQLSDVRIYNHVLSPKEVKEISKGLVLHYQLKDLGSTEQHKNLLPDTNVNSLTKVIGAANRYYEQKSQSGYTATWESISDPPVPGILWGVRYVITAVNGFHGVTWYDGNTISVDAESYTLSCYAKRVSGTNVQLKFEYGKSPYVTETLTMANDNEWHQYSWTFTPETASGQAAASGTTRIYGPGPASISEIIVCGWKLEKGTIATPWTETGNIIVDCSGFNHHGVTIGTLSNPTNSVRFDKAVKFSATTQHIMVPDFPTSGFGDSYTFAWWGTRSANNTMFWSFANGIKLNGMYNGNLWNTFDSSDNPLYAPGTTTQVTAPAVNTWNYWVMTGDGTSCKVYKDGELFGVAKTYKSISGSTFFINGYCALTNYASNNLTISDFRIYSTALSVDDVKELFKTSMTTSGTAREVI